MATIPPHDDLAQLREQFPGWAFHVHWTTANSGPDVRSLIATRGDVVLSAWTAAELAALIRRHEP
jgi:hypothetical protein